ncbi:MAG: hypothetical protein DMG05_08980 [Acidobacteria bacterium]|nr:MAG: hypothetical protein DMG05_08980 [Acidobacteriota bacterium]
MRFWRNLACVLLLLLSSLLSYEYWLCYRAQTPVNGKARLPGLQHPVEVIRDAIGVPHIFAQSFADAIFTQGYVTAQDRLWQMDLLRRSGYGELSEILGPRALEIDKEQRLFGFRWVVTRQEENLPPEDFHCLQRYAAGVNAFLQLHRDRLPIEFHILRYQPAAWSPRDTLVLNLWIGKLLSTSWDIDLMRELVYKKLDRKIAEQLLVECSPKDSLVVGSDNHSLERAISRLGAFPFGSLENPLLGGEKASAFGVGPAVRDNPPLRPSSGGECAFSSLVVPPQGGMENEMMDSLEISELRRLLRPRTAGETEESMGSNNWVVAGRRTASGKPILANDPHLRYGVPSIWHMAHLNVPGILNVIGVTIPGAPGIILGHNENIAWGATNLAPDVQDLYIEKIHPQDHNRYRVNDSWQEMEEHQEIINIKGRKPEVLKIRSTRHGPVFRELAGRVLALRWTLLDERISLPIAGKLNTARNWEEFQLAMKKYSGPVQNFVYADRQGNIGFLNAGKIPVRARGDGSVPVPGETDDYEWTGYIPFDELPRSFNPASGMIVTANNRIVGKSYPHFLTHQWASPHRAQRIQHLLETKSRLKVADMLQIQGDAYSSTNQIVSRSVLEAIRHREDAASQEALDVPVKEIERQLENWDCLAQTDSVGTTICEEFRETFLEEILKSQLGQDWKVYQWFNKSTFIENLLQMRNPEFLPKQYSSYHSFILACLQETLGRLKDRYKTAEPKRWLWGDYFPVEFRHPLGQFWPLTKLFNTGPIPQPGTPLTVKQTSSRVGVSMRMVIDFADFEQSVNNITLGQSGLVFSQHYRDQFDHWLKVQSYPMLFSRAKIEQQRQSTLLLVP